MRKKFLESIEKSPHENLLGGWLILLLGLFILSIAVLDSVPKLRAYDWVEGAGRVAATDIYQRTGRSHAWCGRVTYTYIVDARNYKSQNLSSSLISDMGCDIDKARVISQLATLPIGSVIRIFYDAGAPERVAIRREGLEWHDFFFWFLTSALISVGVYTIVQARRIIRLRREDNTIKKTGPSWGDFSSKVEFVSPVDSKLLS